MEIFMPSFFTIRQPQIIPKIQKVYVMWIDIVLESLGIVSGTISLTNVFTNWYGSFTALWIIIINMVVFAEMFHWIRGTFCQNQSIAYRLCTLPARIVISGLISMNCIVYIGKTSGNWMMSIFASCLMVGVILLRRLLDTRAQVCKERV